MSEVIHIKHGHEDGIRVLLDEPVGLVTSHSVVNVDTPAGNIEIHLAGQRELIVPSTSTALHFADGSTYTFGDK